MNPTASVVICNYNRCEELRKCLLSVSQQTYPPFETIVVDDHSTDDSVFMVEKEFPEAKIIVNQKNLLFARSANIGLAAAGGEMVLFLNNDAWLGKECLAHLVSFLSNNRQAAAAAPLILNPDGTLQSKGIIQQVSSWRIVRNVELQLGTEPKAVHFLSGACFMIRKDVCVSLGGFDPRFVMYWEEIDLFMRIRKKGYQLYVIPKAICWHKQHRVISWWRAWYMVRNRFLFLYKNYPLDVSIMSSLWFMSIGIWERFLAEWKRRRK